MSQLLIYELHTNEGREYVRSNTERLRKAMTEYIKAKQEAGYALSAIEFTWAPIHVVRTV